MLGPRFLTVISQAIWLPATTVAEVSVLVTHISAEVAIGVVMELELLADVGSGVLLDMLAEPGTLVTTPDGTLPRISTVTVVDVFSVPTL